MIVPYNKYNINESSDDRLFDVVVFVANNQEESEYIQRNLFEAGFVWDSPFDDNIRQDLNNYPICLFAEYNIHNLSKKQINYMDSSGIISYGNIEDYIKQCIKDGEKMCEVVFDYRKSKSVNLIFKIGKPEPSYKPRKLDRTLESLTLGEDIPYDQIIFSVYNDDELNYIVNYLSKNTDYKFYGTTDPIEYIKLFQSKPLFRYPMYIFIVFNGKEIHYLDNEKDIDSFIEFLREENDDNANINLNIFDFKDIIYLDSIRRTGKSTPSYKPKKIQRTFESSDFSMCRFKTEEEFIKEYGKNWLSNSNIHWNDEGEMDYLFGTPIKIKGKLDDYDNYTEVTRILRKEGGNVWFIYKNMLKQLEPSYKPRKIERISESNTKIFLPISVYCETRNQCIEFEDFLHKLGYVYINNQEYLIRDSNYREITFYDFNTRDKKFNAATGKKINDYEMLAYSENLYKIKRYLLPEPSYKPRKIERTLETVHNIPNIPKYPPKLSPEQQRELFQVGDIVYIRPDAFNYFNDIEPGGMGKYLGKFVKITEINTFQSFYGNSGRNVGDIYYPDDLLIWVKSSDHDYVDSNTWYWSYKCLQSLKKLKPSYKPRKIDRTIESLNENYVFFKDNHLINKDYKPPKFKIGDDVVIKKNGYLTHKDNISYEESIGIIDRFKRNEGKKCKIEELAYELANNRWYCYITIEDSKEYIYEGALQLFAPSYEPRKINRILEGRGNNIIHSDYKYNSIVIRVKIEEKHLVDEILDLIGQHYKINYFDRLKNGIASDYLHMNQDAYIRLFNDSDNPDIIEMSYGPLNRLEQLNREGGFDIEKLFTIDDLRNGLIEDIKKFGKCNPKPTYNPRKIDRTLG